MVLSNKGLSTENRIFIWPRVRMAFNDSVLNFSLIPEVILTLSD